MMKLIFISILINASLKTANPVEHDDGDFLRDFHLLANMNGLKNLHSIKTILMKYVRSRFPHTDKYQHTRIVKALIHKIKEKILKEIRKENLKSKLLAKEEMLIRMLK
eukprot:GFUD01064470.1.p1 GENE.GFUD01064470.1~~GFUD01064470.1.p1  ORF type:complete len:108 (-),score=32.65 GFUD01064470.1:32-355(-)